VQKHSSEAYLVQIEELEAVALHALLRLGSDLTQLAMRRLAYALEVVGHLRSEHGGM